MSLVRCVHWNLGGVFLSTAGPGLEFHGRRPGRDLGRLLGILTRLCTGGQLLTYAFYGVLFSIFCFSAVSVGLLAMYRSERTSVIAVSDFVQGSGALSGLR